MQSRFWQRGILILIALTLVLVVNGCPFLVPECSYGVGPGVAAMCPAPQLGVVVDPEMRIIDVDVGSPAEQAGLQRGDLLLAIEGISFATDKEEAANRISSAKWKETLRLQLRRNGQELEIKITPSPGWERPDPTVTPAWSPLDYF